MMWYLYHRWVGCDKGKAEYWEWREVRASRQLCGGQHAERSEQAKLGGPDSPVFRPQQGGSLYMYWTSGCWAGMRRSSKLLRVFASFRLGWSLWHAAAQQRRV